MQERGVEYPNYRAFKKDPQGTQEKVNSKKGAKIPNQAYGTRGVWLA